MSGKKPFLNVGALHPSKSAFDWSHESKFTCDLGELVPVFCEEVMPGATLKLGNQSVIRFQPLVAPVLHEINVYTHYFFVPYRLLWKDWENFITGGKNGDYASLPPSIIPQNYKKYSFWDYVYSAPVNVPNPSSDSDISWMEFMPNAFPALAYQFIYDEFYRDEDLQDATLSGDYELPLSTNNASYIASGVASSVLKHRSWEKDYFTSARPWILRGTAPAFPITINSSFGFDFPYDKGTTQYWLKNMNATTDASSEVRIFKPSSQQYLTVDSYTDGTSNYFAPSETYFNNAFKSYISPVSFDVADTRKIFQITKFMERNARAGVRYTEFLQAHFGISPSDARLQRPEYIGGSKSPVLISEVLQNSQTSDTSPQGNLAGKAIAVNSNYVGSYTAQEFGVILGVMSIMPRSNYSQGINRQWLRKSRYDYPFPEFAHLSEQAVTREEIYFTGNKSSDETVFGFQARYNELRTKESKICADMRDTLKYWHLGRLFSSAPELNESFIECEPRKDIFAVQSDERSIIVNYANLCKAILPIPSYGEPGLIDHN